MAGKRRRDVVVTDEIEPEGGPRSWLLPMVESAHSAMIPREEAASRISAAAERSAVRARIRGRARAKGGPPAAIVSSLQPGLVGEFLAAPERGFWLSRMREYYARKGAAVGPVPAHGPRAAALPAVPGANNWVPVGPAVAAGGQADGRPSIGGRTSRFAIVAGGSRIYAATANGGVFRSDDAGASWRSTMDGFDLDPTSFASASLCCGAIAVSVTDPDRVYVGTGEGDTDALFTLRLTNALPAYRGIGPIRSDNGGGSWILEPSTPDLAGFDFFALAVDPDDQDNVVGATNNGLYQRTVSGGSVMWQRRRTGAHTSVVVTRAAGVTNFFAAMRGGGVFRSSNGTAWTALGSGFPTSNVGRIALGVQSDNPNVLYALVANTSGGLQGVYRLDGMTGAWTSISGAPALLPGSQGDYDLCIAVDPANANRIYLGGDRTSVSPFPGSIHRCLVSAAGAAYSMTSTAIGSAAHADVHALDFPPGDPTRLWAGTDGGAFINLDPAGSGQFEPRNTGLSSLCANYLGLSASEPAVMFCGLQDNGTIRYIGEEMWRDVLFGDGGYCVVHPTDPFQVLAYANGKVYRTAVGGRDWGDWTQVIAPAWGIMAEPLVGAPGSPRVAFAAFTAAGAAAIYVSDDFGQTWPAVASPTITVPSGSGGVFSMVFASSTRMYFGTTAGRVFQADLSGGAWTATRIDNAPGGALGLVALIADIAVDWSDATLSSIYVCLGGSGDARHVWHFTGTSWQSRSGSGATSLLDVEHNAILVDPANPTNVYVGADLGVWLSTDSGGTWTPLERGLPDAPVLDLQLHAGARLLRAATHGRGVYEYRLDPPVLGGVELYVRDTFLDLGRGDSTDGRLDPSVWPTGPVWHWLSPNIKVDAPTPAGYQTPTDQIDFLQFHETIVDSSQGVETIGLPEVVHNRLYALVHNRGPLPEPAVQVMAAVTNASTVLKPLPPGYPADVQAGSPLSGTDWTTLGVVTLTDLRPGFPQVAAFDLPSTMLPIPASLPGQSHYCSVTLLHSASDPYTNTERIVDTLTVADRKVAQKNLHIVQFVGTPPPPETTTGMWVRLDVGGHRFGRGTRDPRIDLQVDAAEFGGRLALVAPPALIGRDAIKAAKLATLPRGQLTKWLKQHRDDAVRLQREGKLSERDLARLLDAMTEVEKSPLLEIGGAKVTTLAQLRIRPGSTQTIFIRIDPPAKAKPGAEWRFSVIQRNSRTAEVQGGAAYVVRVVEPFQRQ